MVLRLRGTKNVDGRATFECWHKEAEPHAQRNFDQAAFGVEFPEASCERYAELATPETSDEGLSCDNTQLKDEVEIDDADAIDEGAIEAEIVGEEECSEQTAQVPDMIFQQFGSNNLQFGSVGTINIGRNL
ncbi:MAG: hypothetical protein Q3976_06285 [Corynebacterium sp.]|nr:hypothetical protein [Corynebacterium sp.]